MPLNHQLRFNSIQKPSSLREREKALVDLATAARLDPQNSDVLVKSAGIHHGLSQWQKAVSDATLALARRPNLADAFNVRGAALTQLGAYEKAVTDLSEAIRLDLGMQVASINRAGAYEKMKRDDLARADYEAAARLFPGWFTAHRKIAEFFTERGQHGEAMCSLTRAVDAAPDDARWWALPAEAQAEARQTEQAIADYTATLGLSPGHPAWHAARAELQRALGNSSAALTELNETIRLDPRSANYLRQRAALQRPTGHPDAAAADERRAGNVSDGPTTGQFLFFLALGTLLGWSAAIGLAAALLIRIPALGAAVAAAGAMVYNLWPVRDILLQADVFILLGIGLSTFAGRAWWLIGRALRAAVLNIGRQGSATGHGVA
jgi:tetratricopeptide (TPR) repeat protein